ncbi:hypothetical protein Hanom_Chr17g01590181 [Helianthus anomalus]
MNKHNCYGQPMWGLYTKWALSPTILVFWDEFSCLVCNIGIQARTRSGGLERVSRDQRGSKWWPMEWWPGKSHSLVWYVTTTFVHVQTKEFLVRVCSFIKRTNTNELSAERFMNCLLNIHLFAAITIILQKRTNFIQIFNLKRLSLSSMNKSEDLLVGGDVCSKVI